MRSITTVAFGLWIALGLASAQETKKEDATKKEDENTVTLWIAVVVDQHGKPEFQIGDTYPTQESADDALEKWDKAHPGNDALLKARRIKVRQIPPRPGNKVETPEENSRPKGGRITIPDLKTADPGELKRGGKAKSMAGQTGTGTIGEKKVTITFTGKDGKGTFVVGGDLSGEGKWEQDGAGVKFETNLSRFVGNVDGDKVKGLHFTKKKGEDGKEAMTDWRVTLADTPKPAQGIAGTMWVSRYSSPDSGDGSTTWKFNADQTGEWSFRNLWMGRTFAYDIKFNWKMDGKDSIEVERESGGTNWGKKWLDFKDGKLKGFELSK